MVSPPYSTDPGDEKSRQKELAQRAARIAAMLARWEADDISKEPGWNIDDIEPATLRQLTAAPTPEAESKP